MDGDWGNILYFVLMAAFVIFGALKKKKPVNKTELDTDVQPDEETSIRMEHIFDSLLGTDSFKPQQQYPYQEVEEEFIETEIEDLAREEIKIEPIKYQSPKVITVVDTVDEMDEDDLEFDWKQAIIAKEILDRKYI